MLVLKKASGQDTGVKSVEESTNKIGQKIYTKENVRYKIKKISETKKKLQKFYTDSHCLFLLFWFCFHKNRLFLS